MNFNQNVNIYTRLFLITLLIKSHDTIGRLYKGTKPEQLSEHAKKCVELIKYLQNGATWVESLEKPTSYNGGIEYGDIYGLPAEIAGDRVREIERTLAITITAVKLRAYVHVDDPNKYSIHAGSANVEVEDTSVSLPDTEKVPNLIMLTLNASLGHIEVDTENFPKIDFSGLLIPVIA